MTIGIRDRGLGIGDKASYAALESSQLPVPSPQSLESPSRNGR